jgi:hypothetical protein
VRAKEVVSVKSDMKVGKGGGKREVVRRKKELEGRDENALDGIEREVDERESGKVRESPEVKPKSRKSTTTITIKT